MSLSASEFEAGSSPGIEGAEIDEGGGAGSRLHVKSFKLRFATLHELGRSNVSAVKPLGLPSVVRGKCDSQAVDETREQSALRRVQAMFRAGPRDKHDTPVTTSHEYGWWWTRGRPAVAPLRYHIRDSAWLKERLRVLATDDSLRRR